MLGSGLRTLSWVVVLGSVLILLWGNRVLLGDRLDGMAVDGEAITGAMMDSSTLSWRDIKSLSQDYTEAWNRHDAEAVAAHLSENGLRVINARQRFEGAAAQQQMIAGLMAEVPDLTVEMTRLERDGERVVYHWTLSGTHAASGRPVSVDGVESWLISADGLIVDIEETFDTEGWQAQIGSD